MLQEMIDGELSVRVFELIRATEGTQQHQRHDHPSRQRLEIAIISFLQAFRKIYVGEQVMNTSKVCSSQGTGFPLFCDLLFAVEHVPQECVPVFNTQCCPP